MSLRDVAKAIVPNLIDQGRLIRLPRERTIVFVGDTHGDIDATERIISRHLVSDRTLVFLGDAVDRGPDSAGNLEFILRTKTEHPKSIYLLMGNHEAWSTAPFSPADFWDGLDPRAERTIANALSHLPYAAWHPSGILGLHGALPDLPTLDAFESLELGSDAWRAITWGDWDESVGGSATSEMWERPTFGRSQFESRAGRLGVRVLVRSHQPFAPDYLFDGRCLTIFSSSAYGRGTRQVAVFRPGRKVGSARDLEIESID
ncbi:MAG: metallophosphoesterase family protein [Candidatus Bipolaricaulia bacterium]